MRKEKKVAIVSEALHRMVGELLLKGQTETANAVVTAHKAMSVDDIARLHDILNGASA